MSLSQEIAEAIAFLDAFTVAHAWAIPIAAALAAVIAAIAAAANAAAMLIALHIHSSVRAAKKIDKMDPIRNAFAMMTNINARAKRRTASSASSSASSKSSYSIMVTCNDGGFFSAEEIMGVNHGAVTLANKDAAITIRYSDIASVAFSWNDEPRPNPFIKTYSDNTARS